MRIIVYGAGAIGGVLGGRLALSGKDVVLVARSGHVEAIRRDGLRFVTPLATHILRLPAFTSPQEIEFNPGDVVFLSVKSQDTDEALRRLREVTADVPIFCFQNGVHNEETATRYFPRVYGVMEFIAGLFTVDGEVVSRTEPPGHAMVARYPTGVDDLAEAVAAALSEAGFYTKVTPDVMPYKWGKLLLNLTNAPRAITNGGEADDRAVIRAVEEEAREAMAKANIRWVTWQDLRAEWPEAGLPYRMHTDDQGHRPSSTWQSLTRRTGRVEAEFFNGEILRLAERVGSRAPVNAAILDIVQEMAANRELPGKYTSAQLQALLGV